MATIKLKRNGNPGAVPVPAALALGELALNTADGFAWFKDEASALVKIITSKNNVSDLADGNTYAPKASPAFTGAPTAPTQTFGDNTTKIATTAFVQAAASAIGGASSSPITVAPNLLTADTVLTTTSSKYQLAKTLSSSINVRLPDATLLDEQAVNYIIVNESLYNIAVYTTNGVFLASLAPKQGGAFSVTDKLNADGFIPGVKYATTLLAVTGIISTLAGSSVTICRTNKLSAGQYAISYVIGTNGYVAIAQEDAYGLYTVGTPVNLVTALSLGFGIKYVDVWKQSATKLGIAFTDTTGKDYVSAGTYSGSSLTDVTGYVTVNTGTHTMDSNHSGYYITGARLSDTASFLKYRTATGYSAHVVATVSGSSYSLGTALNGVQNIITDGIGVIDATHVIVYNGFSSFAAQLATISGTTISLTSIIYPSGSMGEYNDFRPNFTRANGHNITIANNDTAPYGGINTMYYTGTTQTSFTLAMQSLLWFEAISDTVGVALSGTFASGYKLHKLDLSTLPVSIIESSVVLDNDTELDLFRIVGMDVVSGRSYIKCFYVDEISGNLNETFISVGGMVI